MLSNDWSEERKISELKLYFSDNIQPYFSQEIVYFFEDQLNLFREHVKIQISDNYH